MDDAVPFFSVLRLQLIFPLRFWHYGMTRDEERQPLARSGAATEMGEIVFGHSRAK
jgi:hypothetical protein